MNATETDIADTGFLPHEISMPLCVHQVGKSMGGREVLRDVTFSMQESQFVALLGSSGSGKTTLLRCISGLISADSGEIRVGGEAVSELRDHAKGRVAVIFQQINLVRRLSALDNVLAGRLGRVRAWRGITRCFECYDRGIAFDCLERVGLQQLAARRVDTLSGGQQQRVAIARALAQQPHLIVADEPVSSLDPSTGAGILGLLRDACRDQGVTVLCSLHQVELAREFADRIVGLAAGTVALDLPANAFDDSHMHLLYEKVQVQGSGA
jgi:phosphonate transport system ATP-binding protein